MNKKILTMDVLSTYLKMEVANAWTILLIYINSITKKPFS